MFRTVTPEEAGISSLSVLEYVRYLNRIGAATHGILMMKGNDIFEEAYWQPYRQESCHRMYSQTKSFVGIAIGLLAEEGKLSLDDCAIDYFPDKIDSPVHPWLRRQTIREMLTMTTVGDRVWWFGAEDPDRVHLYFNHDTVPHPSGSFWEYDSSGTQVLSALVERLSGTSLLNYLRRKLFDKMGTFRTAEILKTPNGDSWGDSAMICTLRDIASFGRLLMQGGEWNGERLIDRSYVKEATSAVVDNCSSTWRTVFSHGYGYYIWRTEQNGFAFVGMGDQITICLPDKDLLFSIVSDNQGAPQLRELLVQAFFTMIADRTVPEKLPKDDGSYAELRAFNESQNLLACVGEKHSPAEREIDGETFFCPENPLGIKWLRFSFGEEEGTLRYENAQGEKCIRFGNGHNVFDFFPEFGYANDAGRVKTTDGFCYRDAVSACWKQKNRLHILVQIIDRYLGNLMMTFSFRDRTVTCTFNKTAENFLDKYQGAFVAEAKE